MVVPGEEAGISVLATVAVVGVSSIVDCVTATIVITGSRSLRAVVGLEVTVVVEAVVAMLEAVVVVVVVVVATSRAAVVAVTPTAFQTVTAGASEILGRYRPLVAELEILSSVGSGAKGVATGCTDVTGNTAEVVARRTGESVVSRTTVLDPGSCLKSARENRNII